MKRSFQDLVDAEAVAPVAGARSGGRSKAALPKVPKEEKKAEVMQTNKPGQSYMDWQPIGKQPKVIL